jgi:hypothetical protein
MIVTPELIEFIGACATTILLGALWIIGQVNGARDQVMTKLDAFMERHAEQRIDFENRLTRLESQADRTVHPLHA